MLEAVLITAATLAVALYLQARHTAREIRRNRAQSSSGAAPLLLYPPEG